MGEAERHTPPITLPLSVSLAVPLVSKICPSDTYKVWKCGQNLRVDTTLLGFDHMMWQRGNRSFIFRGQGQSARCRSEERVTRASKRSLEETNWGGGLLTD